MRNVIVISGVQCFMKVGNLPKEFARFCRTKENSCKQNKMASSNGFARFVVTPDLREYLKEFSEDKNIEIIETKEEVDTYKNLQKLIKYFE